MHVASLSQEKKYAIAWEEFQRPLLGLFPSILVPCKLPFLALCHKRYVPNQYLHEFSVTSSCEEDVTRKLGTLSGEDRHYVCNTTGGLYGLKETVEGQ